MPANPIRLRRLVYYIFSICSVLVFSSVASAQTTSITNDVARPVPGAGNDHIQLLSETVNPANGSVNVKIDLPVPEARGISLPFAITYNSGGAFSFRSPGSRFNCPGHYNISWVAGRWRSPADANLGA
jgi:hypothetical protein